MQISDLQQSWQRTWSNLSLSTSSALFERLVAAYKEPQRHYHSLQHLKECLCHFDAARDCAAHPGEVGIALWFHDAIYEVRAHDNERRSADWAIDELTKAGGSREVIQRVEALIMATCHDALPIDPDQQLLVDIDLAILGASPERFAEYDRQVRAEYSWVPAFLYRTKRKEVLQGFLDRKYIYSTSYFRERLEEQARINLENAIG